MGEGEGERRNRVGCTASTGRTVTLQMLLAADILQPGEATMSIEYLVSNNSSLLCVLSLHVCVNVFCIICYSMFRRNIACFLFTCYYMLVLTNFINFPSCLLINMLVFIYLILLSFRFII